LRGTALITASGSPVPGRKLLTDATANAQILTQRFVQQADVEHAALLVLVDQGDAGRRVDALTRQVPNTSDPATMAAFVSTALGGAEAQASLRRTVQDRVSAEIAQAAAVLHSGRRGQVDHMNRSDPAQAGRASTGPGLGRRRQRLRDGGEEVLNQWLGVLVYEQ
jgi:hypothetical protein